LHHSRIASSSMYAIVKLEARGDDEIAFDVTEFHVSG
jgi:hypothetical protein